MGTEMTVTYHGVIGIVKHCVSSVWYFIRTFLKNH